MRRAGLAVAGAMVTAFLGTLAVWFSVVALVGEQQAMNDYPTQMLANATLGLVVGAMVLLYAAYLGDVPFRSFAFAWNRRDTLYATAMAIITLGMAAGTMLLFDRLGIHELTITWPAWSVLALGLIGQLGVVHEELLFRGYILARLHRRYSSTVALVVSAILFMLMHIPFKGAGFMTVSWVLGGLLYGYIYLKSGSLAVALATHVMHNWSLDLFMYSRDGVSLFHFAAIRLVGMEKIGFAFALSAVLFALTYAIYGRGTRFLEAAPRLARCWAEQREDVQLRSEPVLV